MASGLDLAHFEKLLRDLHEQTLGVADLVESSAKPVILDQNSVGRLSRVDAMQGQAMAQASAQRQRVLLKKIAAALARVEQGDYGRCLVCDTWIAAGRLAIDLTAEHCIACAQARET